MTVAEILLLALVGAAAGFLNTLAGGGSAMTLPALMLMGLPGDVANATNRIAVFAQGVVGGAGFLRAGSFRGTQFPAITALTVVGAVGGVLVATVLPNRVFEPLILVCLVGVAVLIAARPRFGGGAAMPRRLGERPAGALGLVAAGFYGGFLQAGVGFMLLAALCGQLHYDLVRGNALKVAVVLVYTVPALVVFLVNGLIDWRFVLPLALGTMAGALAGVRFAVRASGAGLRRFVLVAVVAMCAVLAYRIWG